MCLRYPGSASGRPVTRTQECLEVSYVIRVHIMTSLHPGVGEVRVRVGNTGQIPSTESRLSVPTQTQVHSIN